MMLESTKARYDNFIAEYAKTKWLNASKAVINAGYSKNGSRQTAHNLLTIPYIIEQIAKKKAKMLENIELTGERIIQGFKDIAFQEGNTLSHQALKHKALQDLGKVKGIYEADNLQQQGERLKMDEKERREEIRLASIRLKQGA